MNNKFFAVCLTCIIALTPFSTSANENNIPKYIQDEVNAKVESSQFELPEIKAWEVDLDGNIKPTIPLSQRKQMRRDNTYDYVFQGYDRDRCEKNWNYRETGTFRVENNSNGKMEGQYEQQTTRQIDMNISSNITAGVKFNAFIAEVEAAQGVKVGASVTWNKGCKYGATFEVLPHETVYLTNYQVGVDAKGSLKYAKIDPKYGFQGYYYESAGGTVLDLQDTNVELHY